MTRRGLCVSGLFRPRLALRWHRIRGRVGPRAAEDAPVRRPTAAAGRALCMGSVHRRGIIGLGRRSKSAPRTAPRTKPFARSAAEAGTVAVAVCSQCETCHRRLGSGHAIIDGTRKWDLTGLRNRVGSPHWVGQDGWPSRS